MLWLAKLLVTPLLVWAAAWAMRRWGGLVAGMLVGFPIMTAPIAFFMALEQGPAFGARSAVAILLALSGVSAFAIVYAFIARRVGWPVASACAIGAYFAVSFAIVAWTPPPLIAAIYVFAIVTVGLFIVRRPPPETPAVATPWWDISARMAITAVIVVVVTAAAEAMGPALSAVPATYPAITSVVTPFTHARAGADAARRILRGVLLSHIAFALLFLTVAVSIEAIGVVASYAAALTVALTVSAGVFIADRRLARRARATA